MASVLRKKIFNMWQIAKTFAMDIYASDLSDYPECFVAICKTTILTSSLYLKDILLQVLVLNNGSAYNCEVWNHLIWVYYPKTLG